MAISGLDNLMKTYQSSDNPAIIQAIIMYKNILMNSVIVDSEKDNNIENRNILDISSIQFYRAIIFINKHTNKITKWNISKY